LSGESGNRTANLPVIGRPTLTRFSCNLSDVVNTFQTQHEGHVQSLPHVYETDLNL